MIYLFNTKETNRIEMSFALVPIEYESVIYYTDTSRNLISIFVSANIKQIQESRIIMSIAPPNPHSLPDDLVSCYVGNYVETVRNEDTAIAIFASYVLNDLWVGKKFKDDSTIVIENITFSLSGAKHYIDPNCIEHNKAKFVQKYNEIHRKIERLLALA